MDSNSTGTPLKKRGIATVIKKGPKRPMHGGPKASKKMRGGDDSTDDDSGGGGSDGGPYCLCRGTDDHRWMICCEFCDDWFHGECIKMTKEIGENLIERFVCPNCTSGKLVTIYKRACSLPSCRKASRLTETPQSAFCSDEHSQMWWERMINKMPKGSLRSSAGDPLSQEELMAILDSEVSGLGRDGKWGIKEDPFAVNTNKDIKDENILELLSDEERSYIDLAARKKKQLEEEASMCNNMLKLIELAQDRRRAAIAAGKIGEDICGYDQRLDAVSARDVFAAYFNSPEGQTVFETSKLADPLGEGNETRGMCERKRCKPHSGWQKLLAVGIKNQIREMTEQADEVGEEERVVREAAGERLRRRMAEGNRVEILED